MKRAQHDERRRSRQPECESPIYFDALEFLSPLNYDWEHTDDNELIDMRWRNATLTMRAASFKALLGQELA